MSKLPSLADLNLNIEKAKTLDQFNTLLNQPPPVQWVKQHPMTKTAYVPIDKVEAMLDRIFQQWRIEVISYSALFQSVACHVRLHYLHPVTGEWAYHDGLGAMAVQTNAGASAADLSQIKSAAIMMALPAAKSYAIKDASEHIGKIFGRDLNRKDVVEFTPAYDTSAAERKRVIEWLSGHQRTLEQIQEFETDTKFAAYQNDSEIKKLIEDAKAKI